MIPDKKINLIMEIGENVIVATYMIMMMVSTCCEDDGLFCITSSFLFLWNDHTFIVIIYEWSGG